MTTNELILTMIESGIKLIPQAEGLLDVDGPANALTPELIEALREHKAEILRRMAAIERSMVEPFHRGLYRLISEHGKLLGEPTVHQDLPRCARVSAGKGHSLPSNPHPAAQDALAGQKMTHDTFTAAGSPESKW